MLDHPHELCLVLRDSDEVDRAVDGFDAVVDGEDVAVHEEPALELRRNPGVPRVVQNPALVGHLQLVDHLANADGLPRNPEGVNASFGRRHAALEQDTALEHAERHILIELDVFLEEEVVELRPNSQIVDRVADRSLFRDCDACRRGHADEQLCASGEHERAGQQEGKRGE